MPKKRKKKGQLMSQPLIYIMAMVVGGLILAFGAFAVINIIDAGEATAIKTELQELDSRVQSMVFLDVGSAESYEIAFPSRIQYLCVKNANQIRNIPQILSPEDVALINANPARNIFVVPTTAYDINLFGSIDNLIPQGEINCFPNNIKVKIETVPEGLVQIGPLA